MALREHLGADSKAPIFLLTVSVLAGCGMPDESTTYQGSRDQESTGIAIPRAIAEVKTINQSDLQLEATVYGENSGLVEMETWFDGSNWRATADLDPSDSYTYRLTWYDGNYSIALASHSHTSSSESINISANQYEYAFDYDGDGATNITELRAGTDPTARDSQESCSWPSCDVIIPRVYETPVIDGLDNDSVWREAVLRDQNGDILYIHNLLVDNKNHTDQSPVHRWKAMHDGEYLYLWIEYTDSVLQHDSPQFDPWQDDSIDVLFDGNNSKRTPYDNVDDYHMIIPFDFGNNEELSGIPGFYDYGNNSNRPIGSEHWPDISWATRHGAKISSNNHNLATFEMRFDLDIIKVPIGERFGIEVQHNDDDDGGDRDAKWGWHHPSGDDRGNRDTSVFGTAVLAIW